MRKIFLYFVSIIFVSSLIFSLACSVVAADSNFIQGLKKTAEGSEGTAGAGYPKVKSPMDAVTKILGSAFTTMFLGISFLGLMIYAGFIWMLARGNAQEVERAKNIIIYAVIGLAVVLGAYVITKLAVILWREVKYES